MEILFRGKAIEIGEWVYGYYWYSEKQDKHFICGESNDYGYASIEVDKETVGRFIGIEDKNGVKVYEGDLLAVGGYDYEGPSFDAYGEVIITIYGTGLLDRTTNVIEYLSDLVGSFTTTYEVMGNVDDDEEEE